MSSAIPQAKGSTGARSAAYHDAEETTVEEAEARREVEGVCLGPLRSMHSPCQEALRGMYEL